MTPEPIRYTVSFPAPHTHYAVVEADFPTEGRAAIDLFMPVWTPGSYLVREFARHVEDIAGPAPVTRTSKNRWRAETGGADRIRVTYRVYCREMSVRNNWVEADFALLNGAPTFLTLANDPAPRPHEITVILPEAWKTTMSGMEEIPGGAAHCYIATDYDTLVDSPLLCGNPSIRSFEVDGIPHFLVTEGGDDIWDNTKAAADVEKIVRRYRDMWGGLPYQNKFVFLNLLTETGGGLEHKNSFTIMASRWATRTRGAYLKWLDLFSHEFFHAWNVKRLRPVELGPFNYEAENPTRSLWVAEGFTEYYGGLTVHRAGLTTQAEYLGTGADTEGSLSALIQKLQSTPGRLALSVAQSSFDAWIRLYRPDENSNNVTISYYVKGAVIAWLLDAKIRRATNDAKSLDDVMRLAFGRFSGERGFTPEEIKSTTEEVAGITLAEFFHNAVETPGELDYAEALDWFGLAFRAGTASGKAYLGCETKVDSGRLLVSRVPRGTPAVDAGLNVDDEILAIDDYRVRADQLATKLENYKPGDRISLLIARRDKLMTLTATLAEEPGKWQLEYMPGATSDQKAHLQAWLRN